MVEMESVIGAFCSGHASTVSLSGDGSKSPDFERLNGLHEVWVMCARKKPKCAQVRIIGRFLDINVFVGLKIYDRAKLGSRENYHNAASEIPNIWDGLGLGKVYSGEAPELYFGENVRNLDDL